MSRVLFNELQIPKSPARYFFINTLDALRNIIAFNPPSSPHFTEAEVVKQRCYRTCVFSHLWGGVNSSPRQLTMRVYTRTHICTLTRKGEADTTLNEYKNKGSPAPSSGRFWGRENLWIQLQLHDLWVSFPSVKMAYVKHGSVVRLNIGKWKWVIITVVSQKFGFLTIKYEEKICYISCPPFETLGTIWVSFKFF